MRQRWSLLVMLTGALTFLAALYLPWKQEHGHAGGSGVLSLLNLAGDQATFSGWASGVGDAAAVVAVALAAATALAFLRPQLVDRAPLGTLSVLTAYLALAVALLLRTHFAFDAAVNHVGYSWTYGAYLGVGAAFATLLAAAALRGLPLPRRPLEAVGATVGLALLVSFLLPWHRVPYPIQHAHATFTSLGVTPSTVLAATMIAFALSHERLAPILWAGAAVFTFGSFGFGQASFGRAYGLWLAFGLALALFGVALAAARGARRPARLAPLDAALVGAAAILVVSLFLPWERLCEPSGGRCFSETGWTLPGTSAAALASFAGIAVILRLRSSRTAELTAGTALLVATAGFSGSFADALPHVRFAYGAMIGFAAGALLLALGMSRGRVPRLDRARLVARLLPIAASLALLAGVAIPWWTVLPAPWQQQATALTGWLAVIGLLLSFHLLCSWLRNAQGSTRVRSELLLLPLATLAFVALQLILERDEGVTWGGGIAVGLCLFLAALGWLESHRGLESFRVPEEIWRVDRLPEAES